jgi:hypothetical protein
MIALHFRDSPADIFRRASCNCREAIVTSAVCPLAKTRIPVPSALDTHTHRASIDSQFLITDNLSPFIAEVKHLLHTVRTFVIRHKIFRQKQ